MVFYTDPSLSHLLALSPQVYRHMNVGSAKVQPSECAGVPHHVLDVVDTMNEVFSVGDYYQLATAALEVDWLVVSREASHLPLANTEILREAGDAM